MIVTVSTVKDSVERIQRFVDRNCRRGVDHMVVFLDADQRDVEDRFSGDDRVTVVPTARGWWAGDERPPGLNRRQNNNASAVNTLLTTLPWATWLFHIDADEVVHLDRDALEGLDDSVRAVRLRALEAVSTPTEQPADQPVGQPVHEFKRPLTDDDLLLLHRLGLVSKPTNPAYFRGHAGKFGLRPSLDLGVGVHWPIRDGVPDRTGVLEADWLRLLHLESLSFAEFERKWRNLATSGPRRGAQMAPERAELAVAVHALLDLGLTAETTRTYLRVLYERSVQDPVEALRDLGLLEEVALDDERYVPRPPPADGLSALRTGLEALAAVGKTALRAGRREDREEVLARVGLSAGAGRGTGAAPAASTPGPRR